MTENVYFITSKMSRGPEGLITSFSSGSIGGEQHFICDVDLMELPLDRAQEKHRLMEDLILLLNRERATRSIPRIREGRIGDDRNLFDLVDETFRRELGEHSPDSIAGDVESNNPLVGAVGLLETYRGIQGSITHGTLSHPASYRSSEDPKQYVGNYGSEETLKKVLDISLKKFR